MPANLKIFGLVFSGFAVVGGGAAVAPAGGGHLSSFSTEKLFVENIASKAPQSEYQVSHVEPVPLDSEPSHLERTLDDQIAEGAKKEIFADTMPFNCADERFVNEQANPNGSQIYNKVKLTTSGAWLNIDNVIVNGGKGIIAKGYYEPLKIGPVNVKGANWAFYTEDKSRIRDLSIENIFITEAIREGIRIRGDVQRANIRNFQIIKESDRKSGPEVPIGIHVIDGRDIEIEDGLATGFKMKEVAGTYTNGDGIASERNVHGLIIRRVCAVDNSDGGFDLKSSKTVLEDTHAERNGWSYRFWDDVKAGTIYSKDPSSGHIWVGDGAEIEIDKLVARSDSAVYVIWAKRNAKSITIHSCDLDVPNAKAFFRVEGNSTNVKLNLGPGCLLKRG